MKTETLAPMTAATPTYRTVNGRKMVLLEVAEFERLRRSANDVLPPLPAPRANGNYPAIEYARASLARKIILDRLKAGLSQQELARLAGIRLKTLCRAESGKHTSSVPTIDKIDRALQRALKRKKPPA